METGLKNYALCMLCAHQSFHIGLFHKKFKKVFQTIYARVFTISWSYSFTEENTAQRENESYVRLLC